MFIENKYTNCYNRIIQRAKDRKINLYTERHHVIPKSLGGSDETDNLVRLTAKEHFICHMLLVRMTTGEPKKKMSYAMWLLCNMENESQERYAPTASQYELIRTNFSKTMSDRMAEFSKSRDYAGENNPFHGKTHSEKSLEKMSTVKMGKNNPNYGIIQLPEWNKAKSDAQIGIAKPVLVCENCQQEVGGHGNYKRWHGVNCKKIKVLELS
jgi:hypothetical protein